jgi:hypothetical protein
MKKNLTLTENAEMAFKRLRRNKDFLLFLGEVIINGVTITADGNNDSDAEGIKIGIINEKK